MQKDLTQMTKEELLEHRNSLEKEIARCHNMQLAKKIQLNSVYGALG
jgi:ribosomal protein L29